MANPSKKIREQRDDLSPFLFHYTKGREAFEILLSIIDEKKLKSEKMSLQNLDGNYPL